MLLKEAELKVDDLTTAVVHVSYTTSSEVKVIHIALIDFLLHTNRKISLEKSPSLLHTYCIPTEKFPLKNPPPPRSMSLYN